MNIFDRAISDRDTLLVSLIADDYHATFAYQRNDGLALLRRLAKTHNTDAIPLAVERATGRGKSAFEVARALGVDLSVVEAHVAAQYARVNQGGQES